VRTTMAAPYRGEELSLQELFSVFSRKLEEVLTDPNKYVIQVTLQMDTLFKGCRFSKLKVDEVRTPWAFFGA